MTDNELVPGRCDRPVIRIEQDPFLKIETMVRKTCGFQLRADFTCPNADSHMWEPTPFDGAR